nr:elongation factor 1-gamma-like [Ipomoea batatas]
MNPIGKVPVLETPEGPVFESNAIARYVVRLKPDNPLFGSSLIEYAHSPLPPTTGISLTAETTAFLPTTLRLLPLYLPSTNAKLRTISSPISSNAAEAYIRCALPTDLEETYEMRATIIGQPTGGSGFEGEFEKKREIGRSRRSTATTLRIQVSSGEDPSKQRWLVLERSTATTTPTIDVEATVVVGVVNQ